MVEHVVLAEVSRHAIDYDGMVDANSTAFHAVGSEDDVVRFMAEVAAGMNSPPFHQLERERSILKTEAVRFGSTAFSNMCQLRFGNRSFGRLDWREYGLDTIAEPDLDEWLASYFHTGRAAIWIDAENPMRSPLDWSSRSVSRTDRSPIEQPLRSYQPRPASTRTTPRQSSRTSALAPSQRWQRCGFSRTGSRTTSVTSAVSPITSRPIISRLPLPSPMRSSRATAFRQRRRRRRHDAALHRQVR